MNYEIHVYLGTACIGKGSTHKYPEGEKHAILLYLKERQDSEYHGDKAKEAVAVRSLYNIEFSKVGKLSIERLRTDEQMRNYNCAMESGSA